MIDPDGIGDLAAWLSSFSHILIGPGTIGAAAALWRLDRTINALTIRMDYLESYLLPEATKARRHGND